MSDLPSNLITFEGTLEEFYSKVNEHDGLVVVKFGSTTCMPCRRLRQLLPAIANDNPAVLFINVEIDQSPEIGKPYNISSVPNVAYFKGKDESGHPKNVANVVGLQVPQIKQKIAELK